MTPRTPSLRRAATLLLALAATAAAWALPGALEARADECLADVPAPGAEPRDGGAGFVLFNNGTYSYPGSTEVLPTVHGFWSFDFDKYRDILDDGIYGVNASEVQVRDVTGGGEFRHLFYLEFERSGTTQSFFTVITNSAAPEVPDPNAIYLGRTYAFRVRAVSRYLDPGGNEICNFPWSQEVELTTPSDGTPGINVSSPALDFGDVELGFAARRTLTIRNGDAAAMTIKLSKSKAPFVHDAKSVVLEPGESADVRVTFTPADEGAASRELRLTGPKGVATVVVPMAARGTPATPRLSFDATTLDFGRIRGSAKQTLAVTNRTDQELDVLVSAPRAPFYRLTSGTLVLPPRGTVFAEFEFIPREAKVRFDGAVRFTVLNVRDSPKQSVALTGGIQDTLVVKSKSIGDGTGVEYRIVPGDWTELTAGQELPPGAEVRCDPDASVEMELPDGTQVDMGPGTSIKLSAFFKKGGRVEAEILAQFGEIISRIPRHDVVRSDFKVRAPSSTASVRGTAFTTSIDAVTGDTTYRVTEGIVAVKPTARGAKLVLVRAGFQVTVTKSGAGPVTPYVP